jgi:hypothetical protein
VHRVATAGEAGAGHCRYERLVDRGEEAEGDGCEDDRGLHELRRGRHRAVDVDAWVPETRSGPSRSAWAGCRGVHLMRVLAVSACSRAGVLRGRSDSENEFEILLLRHELAVLRRQVGRTRCRPADRVSLAGLARMLPRDRWGSVFVRPETIRRWHRCWSRGVGRVHIDRRADRLPTQACGYWLCGWRGRTRVGATGGSKASSPGWDPGRGQHRLVDPATGRHRPGTTPLDRDVA